MGLSAPGIGSNLDINTIVTQLMAVEGRKLSTLQTQEASYQAKVSAFGQVQSAFSTFQTAVNSLSTVQQFQMATATASDAAVLSAKATSAATPGAYSLEVSKLAQAQKLATAGQASTTAAIGTGTITFQFGTIAGKDGAALVRDADGKYANATFTQGAAETKSVTIGPNSSSLAGIRDAINGAKIGVTATIVNDGGAQPNRLVLTNSATGEASSMKISVGDGDAGGGLAGLLGHDPSGAAQNMKETVAAQDAHFTIDGLAVRKPSNTVTDAIAGVTLNLSKTNAGTPTTLTVARDSASVVTAVNKFVSAYNAISKTLADASAYDPTTRTAAILNGDSSIRGAQNQLRSLLSNSVAGGYGAFSRLSDIGVTMQKNGTLELNTTKLTAALESNFNDVAGLFAAAGKATDSLVSYTTSSAATKAGSYGVSISQMASQTSMTGSAPAATTFDAGASELSVGVNGSQSKITLNASYASPDALAVDLQSRINASTAFAGSPVKVTVVDGKIAITSDAYGSSSAFTVSGAASSGVFGAGGAVTVAGQDVAGTINGASATGKGRILTAASGDASEGLQVAVAGGTLGERGAINFSRGYASQFGALVGTIIGENGSLDARTKGLNASITSLRKQEEAEQTRLSNREAALRKQFTALDTQISKLNSVSSYLTQQLAQISALSTSSD